VKLPEPLGGLVKGHAWGQVEDQRADLGAEEMVRARAAKRRQRRVLRPGEEVKHHRGVGVAADLPPVGRGQTAQHRCQRGRAGVPLGLVQRPVAVEHRAERLGLAALREEPLGGADHLEGTGLALLGGGAPGGDAVAAEHDPDDAGVGQLDGGHVQAELESWPAPRHPHHPVAEALLGQRLPVGGGSQRDASVGVEMVDVGRVDQAVHSRVDRRRRAALAVQAEVECRLHLVLPLHPGIDVHQRPQPVQSQDRQPGFGEGAEVAA
jgi:hypothetical protein